MLADCSSMFNASVQILSFHTWKERRKFQLISAEQLTDSPPCSFVRTVAKRTQLTATEENKGKSKTLENWGSFIINSANTENNRSVSRGHEDFLMFDFFMPYTTFLFLRWWRSDPPYFLWLATTWLGLEMRSGDSIVLEHIKVFQSEGVQGRPFLCHH